MKKLYILVFLTITSCYAWGQNINKVEYYFDTDPGYGLATNITITPATTITGFTFAVPVSSLSDGSHTLYLRARDVNNRWSMVQAKPFYKISGAAPANINKLEYFVDTDPGYGSGTDVSVTAGQTISNFTFTVPLASLSDGSHTLYLRARDAGNRWSMVQAKPFYKISGAAPANINKLEYFVDTDPGYGSSTDVPVTAGQTVSNFTFTVPLASLSDGSHTLYLRARDAGNRWSIVQSKTFIKVNVPAALPNITRVEYFVDTDPGYGSATSVTITPATSLTNLNFTADVSAQPQGAHKLFVRAQDANNKWSLICTRDFTVCNQAIATANAATTMTTSGFTANWSAAAGATGYHIDISVDNFATFVSGYNDKDAGNITTLAITGLTSGTAYKYRVRAVGTCTSGNSSSIDVTTLLTAPTAAAATLLSSTGFTANWNVVTGATGYQLDISADNFATFVAGYNSKALTTTTETVTGLTASTAYKYRVRAVNGGGASANSSPTSVTTLTVEPVATAATSVTQTGFTANWSAVTGASGYRIDLSTDNFVTFVSGYSDKSLSNVTSTSITGLTAATAYKYRVRAVNTSGPSANSNSIDVTTLATGTAPAAPVAIAATVVSQTGFTANWNGVTGATGYQLDISADNFTTFLTGYNSKNVTNTTEIVTGLTASTLYKYRVRASNASGTSASSNSIDVTTLATGTAPVAPVAIAATVISTTGFTANWNTVTGATGYQLDISADNFATFLTGYNSKIVTSTTEVVTGLTINTPYKYRVRASNASGTSANSNTIDVSTSASNLQNQTITFSSIAAKTLGDAPFTLTATASSALAVAYASTSDKITLSGSQVRMVKAGRATITASQAGNTSFSAATPVDQSFCINPAKPTITETGDNTATPTLTSSAGSGNQWFLNGTAISGATNTTLSVTSPGVYTVQAKVDDCTSAASNDFTIIITGDLPTSESVKLYPNPTKDFVFVTGIKGQVMESTVVDAIGRSTTIKSEKQGDLFKGDVNSLSGGMYILKIQEGTQVHFIKFIKQ